MEISWVKVFCYKYDACGGQDFARKLHQLDDSFVLEMEGVKFDTVSIVGDLKPDFTKSAREETFAVLKQWPDISGVESDPSQTYQQSRSTLKGAF